MNGLLSNPFNITYPTAVQTSLDAHALVAKFDPSGRFVATGILNGAAQVWDLDTKAAIRTPDGHVKAVTSLDWSRNSRYLLTSSKDWNIIVWDLASDSQPVRRQATIRFDAPVVSASFHPRNINIILVLLSTGEAYVVDRRKQYKGRYELCEVQDDSDDEGQSIRPRFAFTVARFDPSGKHIFLGTTSSSILVFNTRTKTMVARHRISGAGIMRGLEFDKSGRRLVTNSSDRTLRQFTVPYYPPPSADGEYFEQELEPTYRFNDPINKNAWHGMSYSPDGEWLAGGAADNATHKIYIWDILNEGQFATALDGGRDPLIDLHWHPTKPSMASTTSFGNVLIWHCPTPERWGAFAGGFEEVDENVEYEEQEDEFDIEDENELALRKKKAEEEEVDIVGLGDDVTVQTPEYTQRVVEGDEDIAWALEEPDDDALGWKMKVIIEDDADS
ncbi:WD40 repeat-like protein [Laetiporus sulphureus 93-53]|uniref:WD40 repeat-like protein n=1 Tax=Laetiporus sulphureus 93-53 TaxID=1314785 RepID=A0A165I6C7_9APHY|nr:WD40 repeat-like protein [Laetiporus sulphureus 93-53]KZT12652.1 WD40 repeat-like protein [Laetiporus sulphureus 93-53]